MKKRISFAITLVVVGLGIVLGVTSAQGPTSIYRKVFGSGGTGANGGNVQVSSTLGQPIVGSASGGNISLGSGYWHGEASTLTLVAPNGGENWLVGSQHEIVWMSTGAIANVSLVYSTDNFATDPITITASTTNDGIYDWTVPVIPSSSVRVRVANVADPTINDASDANFTIEPYYICLPLTVKD